MYRYAVAAGRIVYPEHIQFVDFDWRKLERYLTRKMGNAGRVVIAQAQKRSSSIHRVASHLRRSGVMNVHRFLFPLRKNLEIERTLESWEQRFRRETNG